jgi:phospholipid/cholesterol/gamma-HCH transport system substrate-binding protein
MKSTVRMKISTELKVSLIAIATILVLIWGINYLKGRNLLGNHYSLVTFYSETAGLENSAPVLMKGVKIGYVDRVILRTGEEPAIKVILNIDKSYEIPKGSSATLFSADLIGNKAIRIDPGESAGWLQDHDTLSPAVDEGFLEEVQQKLYPILEKAGSLAESLESLSLRLDTLITDPSLDQVLSGLAGITSELEQAMGPGGSLDRSFGNLASFTGMLSDQEEEMKSLIGNLNAVSASLDSAGLDKLATELKGTSEQIRVLVRQINSGEGTAGKFFYSDSLYENLNGLINDLDLLVRDLNENPGDYVRFSVFGKSEKKNK